MIRNALVKFRTSDLVQLNLNLSTEERRYIRRGTQTFTLLDTHTQISTQKQTHTEEVDLNTLVEWLKECSGGEGGVSEGFWEFVIRVHEDSVQTESRRT